jgi:putative N-acetylmannosamine-6-phosphate epimerase/predicted NBD/HSP70 family sugar kinase
MGDILQSLKHCLVVSCQAIAGDPLDDMDTLRRIAASALKGGASGLRVNSVGHVAAMRQETSLPIIGIEKRYFNGELRITPDFASVAALAAAGADIIAMDCTDRPHLEGEPWREILSRAKQELGILIMADVATYAEGMAAVEAGADLVGTTLYGYTNDTAGATGFNWTLLQTLARDCGKPVVAEGNIATPEDARRALLDGAWCVVVGSAITRPRSITANFVRAMQVAAPDVREARLYAVGVDIGGTAIKAALVDRDGTLTHTCSVPTGAKGGRDSIAASTVQAIQFVLDAAKEQGLSPGVIGIASAGAIDVHTGIVFAATENLPGWADFNIRNFITDRFCLPVFVENDAHATALAESRFGEGRRFNSFVAMTLGTGVGGGIFIDGRLQRGALGFAGTVGHQVIRVGGRPCNCGRRGCLEAYVSTAALALEYEMASTIRRDKHETDAEIAFRVAQLAAGGDESAIYAYDVLAAYLSDGLANIFNMLDPEAVILSGGLIDSLPIFVERVQCGVAELLHFGNKRAPLVLRSAAGIFTGVQGAAVSAFDGMANRP